MAYMYHFLMTFIYQIYFKREGNYQPNHRSQKCVEYETISPTEATKKLRSALEKKDYKTMRDLLTLGADIEDKDNACKTTCLQYAAHVGDLDAVTMLLNNGARVDNLASNQASALLFSVEKGHYEIAEMLLKFKSDPNLAESCDGFSPVHTCAHTGRIDIMELLIKYNANVFQKTLKKRHALHYAASSGQTEMVRFLIRCGLDPLEVEQNGSSSLDIARARDNNAMRDIFSDAIAAKKKNKFVTIATQPTIHSI